MPPMNYVFLMGLLSLNFLTAYTETVYRNRMRGTEYDYIVVGAGASGSVVANRLSEDPENHVLLLEAGGPPHGLSDIPYFPWELMHSEMDWEYYTEPQENACLSFSGKQAYFPRGKALGGSTIMNSMVYYRGSQRDYNEWAKGGATGWSWDDVFYYFKKSEDNTDPILADNGYHQKGGYLTVSTASYVSPLRASLIEAGKSLGYDLVDGNGPTQVGMAIVQATVRDGLRCSTEKAFLRPAADRQNLDILTYAHVTKVLVDENKRAHSVRFEQNNVTHVIKAKKEIILSAGAIGTPQILMLSGIGPKEHLQDLGIPVIEDLPVGQNLNDHITHGGQIYLINSSVGLNQARDWTYRNVGELLQGKGPLSVPGANELNLFLNTKYQDPALDWPDIQASIATILFLPTVTEEVKEFLASHRDSDAVGFYPWLSRPKGRGFIKLRSTNPYEHPIIDPRYLSVEDDLNRLVEGMKAIEEYVKAPALQKYGPVRIPEVIPGCEGIDTTSEEYLRCMARGLTLTVYHQSGTCKMGDPKDTSTVLDPELRVKGVTGLRVADASVMPVVPTANTMAPSIMVGEKAADMIRGRFWDPKLNQIVTKNPYLS